MLSVVLMIVVMLSVVALKKAYTVFDKKKIQCQGLEVCSDYIQAVFLARGSY